MGEPGATRAGGPPHLVTTVGHELEDHTADVALRAWGETIADVFEQAALAMMGLMYDISGVAPVERHRVQLEAPDVDLLLAAWLNELLYLLEAERFLGHEFRVEELHVGDDAVARSRGGARLSAEVLGEMDDVGRHAMRDVVKAATLHDLFVRSRDGGWEGHVLLDV